MKAKHEFETEEGYKAYLRIYFAGKALQSFSMLNLESTPEETAVTALAFADELINKLFTK